MPQYMYRAITKEGLIVKNKVESPSKQNLIKNLKNGNLLPIDVVQLNYGNNDKKKRISKKNINNIDEIMKASNSATVKRADKARKKSISEKFNLAFSFSKHVKPRDLMIFTQNFYLLKKADFNNIHALNALIEITDNVTLKGVLQDILAGVEAGENMYTTMEYYSNIFPYIYTNMIKVGELSGSLTQSLEQAVKYLDTNAGINKKLRGIIIPNAIQLVALLVLLFFGCLYTVPTIQNIYTEVGTKDSLPGITIWFSKTLQSIANHWYIPVLIIVSLAVVVILYINTPKGRYRFDYFKYTMPIFGKLFYSLDFSRIIKAMALNLDNGMRIQDALEVSKNVTNNYVMRAMIERSINNIVVGQSWIEPFEESELGSAMTTEMLKVGMQTDLSEMMKKLLDYMEIDIKNTMDHLMAILPQVVYSIVGILLIFVVIVVLVPCIQVYMGNFLFTAAGV